MKKTNYEIMTDKSWIIEVSKAYFNDDLNHIGVLKVFLQKVHCFGRLKISIKKALENRVILLIF